MNLLNKNILSIPLLLGTFFFTACSSHSDIIAISNTHTFDNNYGLIEDSTAENQLAQEQMFLQQAEWEAEKENFEPIVVLKRGEFLEEDYQPQAEIITYKYQFDPKFYSSAEWRKIP